MLTNDTYSFYKPVVHVGSRALWSEFILNIILKLHAKVSFTLCEVQAKGTSKMGKFHCILLSLFLARYGPEKLQANCLHRYGKHCAVFLWR